MKYLLNIAVDWVHSYHMVQKTKALLWLSQNLWNSLCVIGWDHLISHFTSSFGSLEIHSFTFVSLCFELEYTEIVEGMRFLFKVAGPLFTGCDWQCLVFETCVWSHAKKIRWHLFCSSNIWKGFRKPEFCQASDKTVKKLDWIWGDREGRTSLSMFPSQSLLSPPSLPFLFFPRYLSPRIVLLSVPLLCLP